MPPLWSFGFWMSRITYLSEQEVRTVATKLRENKIPADVIHLDTGWFETDWRSDYQFSKTRFPDPAKLFADLKKEGFHVSLWQLPYFVPKNLLFPEIVSQGLAVRDGKGNLPSEDAVLDFSNPKTVDLVSGQAGGAAEAGRRRDQGGLRRGRAVQRPVRLRTHWLLRAQPLSTALQQGGRRRDPQRQPRKLDLGAQRVGRQSALSAALGRRLR